MRRSKARAWSGWILLAGLSVPGIALAQAEAPAGPEAVEPAGQAAGSVEQRTGSSTRQPADAPATRQEEWRRLREAKMQELRPYRPGFFERQILAIEKAERPSILDFNVLGVFPRIQSIASGSQTAFGVRLWQPEIKGSAWDLHASAFYSRVGYEFYDLQFGRIPHKKGQFPLRSTKGDDVYELGTLGLPGTSATILYGSLRYRHYPREDFYGLGPDSLRADHSSFLLQDAWYELVAGYQFTEHVALTGRAGLIQAFVAPGSHETLPSTQALFGDESAPGLAAQPDYLHLATQLFVDYRDEPGNPHRGAMAALQVERFDDRDGSAFEFTRVALDARAYLPLGSSQRVLALRAFLNSDSATGGARVPFYYQETLGGSHTLRGFRNFRFRGEKLLLLQAEYRWEAAPALELVLFADAGRIGSEVSDLTSDMHGSWGGGLRLKAVDTVLVRFDVARSPEDTRLFLRFSPSF
jgi:hypothetical protein